MRKFFKKATAMALATAMVLSGMSATGPVFAAGLEDSKVVHLAFENDVKDSSGNGIDGTLNKDSNYVEGKKGQALKLGGSTYIDLGKSVELQPENLTTSMWIKVDGALTGENMITWFKPNANYQGKGWYLTSLDDNTPLKISIGESAGQPMEAYVSGARSQFFPKGEWVHIAVTFDAATQSVAIYRNGVAQSVQYLNSLSTITQDANSNKYIGFNSPGYNGGFANVTIDEFKVYSVAATADQAIEIYTEDGGAFDFSAVVDADYDNLVFNVDEVKHNITLPSKGESGSTITWTSSDTSVITNDGKVTRPAEGTGDKKVTLTATISYKGTEKTKEFEVTVLENYVFDILDDFDLNQVELKDEYEVNAFNKELTYLKSFDADKLLKGFRVIAGIKSDATVYGGWENTAIKGHTMGHYLTAMAQAYASTGDAEINSKLTYIVDSLAECQGEDGYLAAIPKAHYTQLETGNTAGTWVPWYTMHKVLAGLVDVYEETGNEKALSVASKLGDWIYSRTSTWTDATQATVLAVEYGGMNDCLYELYKYTKKADHLKAAHSFDEMPLFDAMYNGKDVLNGKHANTTIPKIIGALNRYITLGEGEEYYLQVAENFWDIVVNHHTYVTGGNSEWEHFGAPDILNKERTECNCETCNSYNMLKLSRELYKLTGDPKYADYYENTFINAILSSQNPETGMTTYFQPMATGFHKVYSSAFDHFWCCTGSGMESFSKLNDSIYFKGKDNVYVIQFMDSVLTWNEANLKLTQDSNIPNGDTTTFTVNAIDGTTVNTSLKVRVPDWCMGDVVVKVNGTAKECTVSRGIVTIAGPFNDGDKVEVTIPMGVVAYDLPDGANVIALKYGPIVLSAGLGGEGLLNGTTGVNVTIPKIGPSINSRIRVNGMEVEEWLKNVNDYVIKTEGKLEFTLKNTDRKELVFTPHYMQHKERYGIYFVYLEGNAAVEDEKVEYETVDSLPIANDQYEFSHNMKAEKTGTGLHNGLNYRHAEAGGFFSYEMAVDNKATNYLVVKYFSGDHGRTFTIYVDDTVLKEVTIENENPGDFYEVMYELPKVAVAGKDKVTIKFAATGDGYAGGIFDKLSIVKEVDKEAATTTVADSDEDKVAKKRNIFDVILPIIIAVAVIAVIAIVIIVLIVLKKKKGINTDAAVEKLKDVAEDKADDVKEMIEDKADDIKEAVEDVVEDIKDGASKDDK